MGFEIPNTEPATLRVGDTWKWTKDLPDFLPADTWALKYALTLQTTTSALRDGPHQLDSKPDLISEIFCPKILVREGAEDDPKKTT